jgi:hypothetical protein
MVLAVEQPTVDINSQISALKTQEELLHKSLDNLRADHKTVKEYRVRDKELADVTRRRKALVALAQFEVGMGVYKPGTTLSGTITEIRITPGGLGEVWVSWDSGASIPEQPMNIKLEIACEHNFRGIWQADGTLIGYCDCGIMRSPTRELLALHLDNCRQVRCDYAVKVVDGQPQNFVQAVERIDRQIQWLEEHLLQQSSNVDQTPAPDKCGNTHTDNSEATPVHHNLVAPEVCNGCDQKPSPMPEIQERLIDISTGGDDTPQRAPFVNEAHSFSDCEFTDNQNKDALISKPYLGHEYLALEFIAIDGGTQSRACLNDSTVDEYAEAMDGGAEFPSVLVFYDGEKYWLADGFHRVAAAKKLELSEIAATIRKGTRRDAVLYSVGANATHGLRRSNADKRRAVLTLLNDEEWSQWSSREISKRCGVSEFMVRQMRESICDKNADSQNRTVTRNGTTYTMNATNIGVNEAEVFKDGGNDSAVLPVPKFDARKARTSQEFNTEDKDRREPLPDLLPLTSLTSDEITISVVSNVDILSAEQLDVIVEAIEIERQKRLTR